MLIIIIKMTIGKGEGSNRGKASKEIYLGVKGVAYRRRGT